MSQLANAPNSYATDTAPFIGSLATKTDKSAMGTYSGYRNKIINGEFNVWQRGFAQTTAGYGSDDRWINANFGSTKTHSLQNFVLGQSDVPGNPTNFSRTVVTSVAGASNYVAKWQNIEGVSTLAGRTATITFYAKADAIRSICVELEQNFGTIGGSPSPDVTNIGLTTFVLSTSWVKYQIVTNIPSVAGKTLAASGNDRLSLFFWLDAGSQFSSRSGGIGQQSGTFDIAHVSVVEGDASQEADPFSPRHRQQELALCQRYFETGLTYCNIYSAAGNVPGYSQPFAVYKRTSSTLTVISASYASCSSVSLTPLGYSAIYVTVIPNGSQQIAFNIAWTADAEI